MRGAKPKADLRGRLLTLAHARLAERSYQTLSLRELADAAGVAPSAPYRHFVAREALLIALAEEGFQALAERYRQAAALDGTASDRLAMLIHAFIAFACAHANLFRLMFSGPYLEGPATDGETAGQRSFVIFEKVVADTMASPNARDTRIASLSLWAALHGAATLIIDGRMAKLPGQTIDEQAVIDDIVMRYCGTR